MVLSPSEETVLLSLFEGPILTKEDEPVAARLYRRLSDRREERALYPHPEQKDQVR